MTIWNTFSRLRRFCKDANGSTTVEFVLWFPFFLALQGLIADSSLAFLNVNRLYDTARDAGRRASVGELTTLEAEAYARGALPPFIDAIVSISESGTSDVLVQISAPIANLSYFGFFNGLKLGTLDVTYTVRKEFS